MKRIFLIILPALVITSCGNAGEGETSGVAVEEDRMVAPAAERTTGDDDEREVTLNLYAVGENMNTMTYEPERMEVAPGADVTLKLMNKAKSPAMIHNVVIIRAGKQKSVTEDALEAGPERDYIPENPDIIAATELADPGETVEISFKAPDEKGTYQYICTYPGHTSMKGILLVK